MDWLELHINTSPAGLEPVETLLSTLGIDGVIIDDQGEFETFLEENRQYWDYVDEDLRRQGKPGVEKVTLIGVCTDICVLSNALVVKAFLPEAEIFVDASCCAGVTPQSHRTALEAMKACQITVEHEQ